jgi:hypothetical protein
LAQNSPERVENKIILDDELWPLSTHACNIMTKSEPAANYFELTVESAEAGEQQRRAVYPISDEL